MRADLTVRAVAASPGARIRATALPGPVPLRGQLVALPAGFYDWLHLELRTAAAGQADCWLHYAEGLDPEPLSWPQAERVTLRVPVTRRTELAALRLPDHPGAELLSLSLIAPADELVLT